jgi:hypothetical protein
VEGASGDQGKDKDKDKDEDEVYSNSLASGGQATKSPKGKRQDGSEATDGKRKQNKGAVSAARALGALRRGRAPFIADESRIALADDTTLPAHSGSDASVEITMEELPPTRSNGQTFGHQGWVGGGDGDDEDQEPGASAHVSQAAELRAADPSQKLKTKLAHKTESRTKGPSTGSTPRKRSKSRGLSVEGEAEKPPNQQHPRDEFALSDDEKGSLTAGNKSEDKKPKKGANRSSQPDEAEGGSDGSPRKSGRKRRPKQGLQTRPYPKVKEKRADGKGQSSSDANADLSVRKVSEQETSGAFVRTGLDDRPPWAELKAGRREQAKQESSRIRKQAGAEREAQKMLEDLVEEIR